jgi:tubulin-folding cofactor B
MTSIEPEFTVVTQSFVNLTIYTELNAFGVEKRYPKDILIGELKNKLELITGYEAASIKIKLLTRDKKYVCDFDDDSKMLGSYFV